MRSSSLSENLIRKFKVLWLRNILEAKAMHGRNNTEVSEIYQRRAVMYQKDYLIYEAQDIVALGGTNESNDQARD